MNAIGTFLKNPYLFTLRQACHERNRPLDVRSECAERLIQTVVRAILFSVMLMASSSVVAEKITVVTEENPPYNFRGKGDDSITGLGTEVVKEVLKRAKLEYDITLYPWARAYRMAQDNENVAIYSIGRNEQRENLFKWVGYVGRWDVYVYKLKSRTDVTANSIEDLRRYTIGSIRDGFRTQYLQKEGLKTDLASDDVHNLKKLEAGRIDVMPADELALVFLSEKAGVDFNSLEKVIKLDKLTGGLHMAFGLKTPDETVEKCRVALESMVKDGTFDAITARWRARRTGT